MKSLLRNDALQASKLNNRQLTNTQLASNVKLMSEYELAKYDAPECGDALVEVDEMQIDKLYQSL